MHLYDIFSSPKNAVAQSLQKFRVLIEKKEIWQPTEDIQFIFLCGANIGPQVPSKRRQHLIDFSLKKLPHTKFFLAEKIFKVLEKEGHFGNILDTENEISQFADYVIIVLESESSFCELGAFATDRELRNKLIVINDRAHQSSKSFINLGPIQAIRETSSETRVLHYRMDDEGKIYGDGIGVIFNDLHSLLYKKPKARRTRIDQYDPNQFFTKVSLRFLHDLVYFSSPIDLPELSRLVKLLFGKSNDKQLKKHLGLLCAIDQTVRTEEGFYKSTYDTTFFEYKTYDIGSMIASFKNLYLRYDPKRLV